MLEGRPALTIEEARVVFHKVVALTGEDLPPAYGWQHEWLEAPDGWNVLNDRPGLWAHIEANGIWLYYHPPEGEARRPLSATFYPSDGDAVEALGISCPERIEPAPPAAGA